MESASEISTHFRCDNCGTTLHEVTWKQCKICKEFDLCHRCEKLDYAKLLDFVRHDHLQRHIEMSENGLITNDCMESIMVEAAERYANEVRSKKRKQELERIRKEKKIGNDYDISIVMDELEQLKCVSSLATPAPASASEEDRRHELHSLIARYHLEGHERNIRVLSLDGGGTMNDVCFTICFCIVFYF